MTCAFHCVLGVKYMWACRYSCNRIQVLYLSLNSSRLELNHLPSLFGIQHPMCLKNCMQNYYKLYVYVYMCICTHSLNILSKWVWLVVKCASKNRYMYMHVKGFPLGMMIRQRSTLFVSAARHL